MDIIRLASEEEVKTIAEGADLTNATTVVTFGGKDFGVIRICYELDPMIFASDTTDKRKLLFLMNLETALRLQGVKEIYFNIHAKDEAYIKVIENWGGQPVSTEPDIRFKKVL